MQYAFYFNQNRCIGCDTCTVACKDHNGVNAGDVRWRTLTSKESGKGVKLANYNMTIGCNHCDQPYCMAACPTKAISKDESTGAVTIDRNKCEGVGDCMAACPYSRVFMANDTQEPAKAADWKVKHPAQKCTMCYDRLAEGKKPICVDSCINRALDFGTRQYLDDKYGKLDEEAVGFVRENSFPNYFFTKKA